MKVLVLFAAFILCRLYAIPVSGNEKMSLLRKKADVVAFYNVYTAGHYEQIVQEQINTIKGNGLIDRLENVYYTTTGPEGANLTIPERKFIHLAHHGNEGDEVQTLSLLYTFCNANPSSKVLYFHDKGSFHNTTYNEQFRAMLNCYVLNTHCIAALDQHDTCGWRISPIPFIHYSGNFWWAKCSYVNKLVDPMISKTNETFIVAAMNELNGCVGLRGRYFAETWIGTGPRIYPADCMNSTIDNSYIAYTYKMPPAAAEYCHGPGIPSGLPCTTASTYTNVTAFKHPIHMVLSSRKPECRDNRQEVVRRSHLMYGEEPHSYLEWMARLAKVDPLPPDGTLIRYAQLELF